MQEHEYKARDKTVQKMSRDGLREKNLRSKKEKRITGREADEKKTAGHREQELDFGKVRKTHTAEETVCIKEITAEKALPEAISGCETGKSCEGRSACKCTAIYGKSQSCG